MKHDFMNDHSHTILVVATALVLLSLFFFPRPTAFAQSGADEEAAYLDANPEAAAEAEADWVAGIKPTSVLYWLDTLFERIGLWAAQDAETRIQKLIKLQGEKLAEAEVVAGTDNRAAGEALERYEKYLKEAVKAADDEAEKDKDADELYAKISEMTIYHADALVRVGGKAAVAEQPYIEEAFAAIEEQNIKMILAVRDEKERAELFEQLLGGLQKQRDRIPPEVEENIRATMEKMIGSIAALIMDQGSEWVQYLSETLRQYAAEQATQYAEQLNQSQ
ncbi:MAG: DUF5667 domain-containing protein [Candidatus Kerfeldbacteria bacterium]